METSSPPKARTRRLSLHASLIALVSLCVLPAALVSAGLVWSHYSHERERIYAGSVLMADQLAAELDRDGDTAEDRLNRRRAWYRDRSGA